MSKIYPSSLRPFNLYKHKHRRSIRADENGKAPNGCPGVVINVKDFGKSTEKGATLSVHGVGYEVDVGSKICCRKREPKVILKGIDAVFKPGMNAILGPTGSGKSTLTDILAGRKHPKGLTGTLLIDGSPPPENFKCMVGYVVQDDVIMGTLTVRENFQFSAALRLGMNVTESERNRCVDKVIEELGLTTCADVKVGTEFIRGISGGERKRTNIGMELIISPQVLFLDELTTGLDANTANSVMSLLKRNMLVETDLATDRNVWFVQQDMETKGYGEVCAYTSNDLRFFHSFKSYIENESTEACLTSQNINHRVKVANTN